MKFKTVVKVKPTGKYLNGQSLSFELAYKEYQKMKDIYNHLDWAKVYLLPSFIPTGNLKIDWNYFVKGKSVR